MIHAAHLQAAPQSGLPRAPEYVHLMRNGFGHPFLDFLHEQGEVVIGCSEGIRPVTDGGQRGLGHSGEKVDLRYPEPDGFSEIVVRDAGTAVQHERYAGPVTYAFQAVEIEYRFALVIPMNIPDGDRQGVDAGFPDECRGLVRIREQVRVRLGFHSA